MSKKGFLMVTMAPPPAMEDEFNDWYDTEHVPERIAIKEFETANRYVCLNGFPRYMTAYDLTTQHVLDEAPYQAISGDCFSPWSKRILRHVKGLWRVTGEQIYPGNAHAMNSPRVLLLHYRAIAQELVPQFINDLCSTYEGQDQVTQLRIMRYEDSINESASYVALVEGGEGLTAIHGPALDGKIGDCLTIINEYTRYWAYSPDAALNKVVKSQA